MGAETVYLAGDVDAIKDFVFETSSLPQIRGGSELLQECEAEIAEKYRDFVIYCAGGSFLLNVPADQAHRIKAEIEALYRKKTMVATVAVVIEEEEPSLPTASSPRTGWAGRLRRAAGDVPLDGGIAHRLLVLYGRMEEAKNARETAPFYEAFPFGRRCERCGKRMAQDREPVEGGRALCAVCKRRDEKGRKHRGMIRGRFNQEFMEQYRTVIRAEQPEDLDTLLQSAPRKYLALLYADGNDIGKRLQRVKSESGYQALSKALREGTKQALYEALWQACQGELQRADRHWPFEIISIGGDDVIVLLQAGYAWEVAVKFLELFEQEVNGRLSQHPGLREPPVTASCGIAIADGKYPVRYLERLAADLLKEAKRQAKENPEAPRSAVSFLWLPTPIASERVEPLMGIYSLEHAYLTARPYTLKEAQKIQEAVLRIREWPQTTRHRWAEALARGVLFSLNFIQYDLALEKEDKRGIHELMEAISRIISMKSPPGGNSLWIWYETREGNRTVWRTPLLDILELAELHAMRPDVH